MNVSPTPLIRFLLRHGKGIIAADDRPESMNKRLEEFKISPTSKNRTLYREIVATTPGIERYISGVILHEETLIATLSSGRSFHETLHARGIITGVKVDQGLEPYNKSAEQTTKGIGTLSKRLVEYKKHGAQFCKWRCVFIITDSTPSDDLIKENAKNLAMYVKTVLASDLVPIIEPEVLMEGNHSLSDCHEVTRRVLQSVFDAIENEKINMAHIILKCNMILPGKKAKVKASPQEVAYETVECLHSAVPAETGGIVFLSGGQSTIEAILNLNAIFKISPLPWPVSFSFDRAFM